MKDACEAKIDQDWDDVVVQLGRNGTDIALNASDPQGDGDQRPLRNKSHATLHRTLFATGGHLEYMLQHKLLPEFPMRCLLGLASECERMLNNCTTEEAKNKLLETRSYIPSFFLH